MADIPAAVQRFLDGVETGDWAGIEQHLAPDVVYDASVPGWRYQYQGVFGDAKERQVSRIVLDSEGGIVMLDRDEKTVRVWDEAGRALRAIATRGPGYDLRKPIDVAVDAFRNAYVADEEGAVLVFSPAGQLLASIGAQELKKPRAVALEPSGAVLVYDEKLQRILRFK